MQLLYEFALAEKKKVTRGSLPTASSDLKSHSDTFTAFNTRSEELYKYEYFKQGFHRHLFITSLQSPRLTPDNVWAFLLTPHNWHPARTCTASNTRIRQHCLIDHKSPSEHVCIFASLKWFVDAAYLCPCACGILFRSILICRLSHPRRWRDLRSEHSSGKFVKSRVFSEDKFN